MKKHPVLPFQEGTTGYCLLYQGTNGWYDCHYPYHSLSFSFKSGLRRTGIPNKKEAKENLVKRIGTEGLHKRTGTPKKAFKKDKNPKGSHKGTDKAPMDSAREEEWHPCGPFLGALCRSCLKEFNRKHGLQKGSLKKRRCHIAYKVIPFQQGTPTGIFVKHEHKLLFCQGSFFGTTVPIKCL